MESRRRSGVQVSLLLESPKHTMEISGSAHVDWAQLDQCVEKSLRKHWKMLQLIVTAEKNAASSLHLVYSLGEITVKISLELYMLNTLVKVHFYKFSCE